MSFEKFLMWVENHKHLDQIQCTLDDLVYDAKCDEGGRINNSGIEAQLRFLVMNGGLFTIDQLKGILDEE